MHQYDFDEPTPLRPTEQDADLEHILSLLKDESQTQDPAAEHHIEIEEEAPVSSATPSEPEVEEAPLPPKEEPLPHEELKLQEEVVTPPPPQSSSTAGQAEEAYPANPQVLFSWKAPLRPYVKRSKKVVRFYLALALLLSLIILFFGRDWILLIPIWTVLFLFYVLTITPPQEIEHKITQFGIETAGIKLRWEILSHFHFDKRFGYDILTVVSRGPYFDHFYMVVPSEEIKKKLLVLLSGHLLYEEEPRKGFVDRLIYAFSRLVPQEA